MVMMRGLKLMMAAAIATLAYAAPAHALVIIDFGTGSAPSGGSIVTNAAHTTAVGTNILVDRLGGCLACGTAGEVDFNYDLSGANGGVGGIDANGTALLNFNTVAGTLSIVGGVPGLGIPNGTLLVNGTTDTFNVKCSSTGANPCSQITVDTIAGPDTKSPLLLRALGLPLGATFTLANGFSIGNITTVANTYKAFSTDIPNNSDVTPEPGSMLLFGTGLIGLTSVLRRRMKKN
jgi:hypothetical protein